MSPEDTDISEGGEEVLFGRRRSGSRPVRVMPMRQAALAIVLSVATSALGTGALWTWAAERFVDQRIQAHDRDPQAHTFILRQLDQGMYSDAENSREKAQLRNQLDQIQRDLQATREAVARLEARLSGGPVK